MLRAAALLSLLLALPVSADAVRAESPVSRLSIAPCAVPRQDESGPVAGETVAARCGTFTVPENRTAGRGRMLPLKVIVFPSRAPRAATKAPIFFFSGGPGQAATEALWFAGSWQQEEHDVVLVDLRGTGEGTALDCPSGGSDEDPQSYLRPYLSQGTGFAACRDELAKRADLTQYTTTIAMRDVDELRQALGYRQIAIEGGSYGTRAAMEYIRLFPGRVHSAVLYSLVPVENRAPLFHARAARRAYDLMVSQCEAEAACRAAYPTLSGDAATIMKRLEAQPARVTIPNPATGRPVDVTLTASGFADALRVMLYGIENERRVPLLLSRALRGDYTPFAAAGLANNRGFSGSIRTGLLLSFTCAEDTWRIRPEEVERESAGSFLGTLRVRAQMAACSVWPKGKVPASYYRPPVSRVPVLLVSGYLDPVAPPEWGEVARRRFPNGVHVVVPGGTHTPTNACIEGLARKLFATGSVKGLDVTCVAREPVPPFELPGGREATP
ncbi:MAG TPA: alpha/beta hydrolase [Allosphingosinicella sp.]|jgi:pimeloyl-ACP methyl ester carboxylesterase